MAKRHLLLFLALVMLSINAFSQTTDSQGRIIISNATDFLKIGTNGYPANGSYIQTADIDLGDRGTIADAIISTEFKGTYDGDGYTITYQAHFNGTTTKGDYGLFSTVSGTIKNLNVDANVTFSGTANDMQVGLLCGYLIYPGVVESCNVSGNINSTVQAGNNGGTDAGLVVGECAGGTIKYCNAIGNVTGVGYVGGIVGQMSIKLEVIIIVPISRYPTVLGCSFVGSVTANNPNDTSTVYKGSFAGGICGFANTGATINLCYVNADIISGKQTHGVASTNEASKLVANGSPTVTNNYAEGTVNGQPIGAGNITNSTGNTSYNYYPGGSTQNGGTEMGSQQIADSLNKAAAGDTNIHFSPVGDDNVIFGKVIKVCEAPTNLTITNNGGTYTATWQVAGTDNGTDNTVQESKWRWTLSGGNLATASQGEVNAKTLSSSLEASPNPYTFTVYTDCSTAQNGLLSGSASIEFFVDCPTPTDLTASDITDNGFTISWDADVECQLTVNGEPIPAGNTMEETITGLDPETQYTVTVKAKCGEEYVEQASINVTTARLAAPTRLAVNTVWNGSEESGTATISWDMVDGLTYEIEGQTGNPESEFAITGLDEGNYTLRLRAKKGTKTSDWVSMPYTISSPDAPKNPQVEYTRNGDAYYVTVRWYAGSTENDGWIVNGVGVQDTFYVLPAPQTPGTEMTLSIVEKVDLSTSGALQVPIQVPCLPVEEETLPEFTTTQTTATFVFSDPKAGRSIILGSDEYEAEDTNPIIISGLTPGTTYLYEVREYCGTKYSSKSGTFVTVACLQVSNLATSNIGTNSAKVSWSSQSSLQYQVVLKKGETIVSTQTQPEKMITFNSLDKAAEYTVEVSETCGSDWGTPKTVTFTTLGDYSTVKTGAFNVATTWEGGNIPDGNDGNIIINQGHTLTLNVDLVLTGECRILNQGVLEILAGSQLINTTDENVGGIIEVSTPQKTINQWTFIGAPFENKYGDENDGYTLGTILPVSGSDISVSKYDYKKTNDDETANPGWSDSWATVDTKMETGEGYFAWPFYGGVVTYTTYGDVCTWDRQANNGEGAWVNNGYQPNQQPKTALNNADEITITAKKEDFNGGWMALANPYPAKLSVDKFVAANNTNIAEGTETSGNTTIQGQCIYKLTNNVSSDNSNQQAWDIVFANNTNETVKDIAMTEGFFVNLESGNQVIFSKEQLTNYPSSKSKSQVSPREFIELSLVKGNHKSKLYFAHNQEAEQNYDIFDANKLFALGEIAEPYFVTDGIALVKEEVKELPYYATMNVRSYKDDTISFVVENIPEGISVFLIDNEEEIKMSENIAYTTLISEGENADRFQVLFKKASIIEEAKDSDITITNSNRLVNVASEQTDLRIEVYNALGQRVFTTNDYNFTLNQVSAGTYMIKAFNNKVSKTQKIVVE